MHLLQKSVETTSHFLMVILHLQLEGVSLSYAWSINKSPKNAFQI